MAEVDDPGKLLFSIDLKERTKAEYLKMGRSIQMRNSNKIFLYAVAAIIVIIAFSIVITPFIAVLALAIAIEMVVYFEYSARNIAAKISGKVPLHYEFFEDGLTESSAGSEPNLTWYNETRRIKKTDFMYTFICRTDVFVIPRDLLDERSEELIGKLEKQIVARNKNHSPKHMKRKA